MRAVPLIVRFPALVVLLVAIAATGCRREDPARAELRTRLKQEPQLSPEEVGRVLDEVVRSIGGRPVRATDGSAETELDPRERDAVLGMLTDRVGIYDEGLRTSDATVVRVINAPGISLHTEYSAARRLMIDVETFLPRRFEFNHEFPFQGDYAFDLIVE
jgi:hypothetical protein